MHPPQILFTSILNFILLILINTIIPHLITHTIVIKKDTTVIAAIFTTQANLNEEDLQNHAKKRLANYKNPRVYIKSEIIPTVNNGKISRKNLSKTFKGLSIDST